MTSFLVQKKQSQTFQDKIGKLAVKTQENIKASRNSFDRFCKSYYEGRTIDAIFKELKTMKGEDQNQAVRDLIQAWIDWQYQGGSLTMSVKQYISKIKRVFNHYGIYYHIEDFAEPLEYKPVVKEELHELTMEEIQKIFAVALPRRAGFYLALISTGARPGELLQVRKKDIDTSGRRIKIRIESENVKTRSGRSVWLTKEAGSFLMTRIKDMKDNDLVWATNENPSFAEKAESTMFNKYTKEAGFTKKYKSNGFRMITLYSFRSFFFGRASDVHREGYAHRMTGHGGYLPQYDRMSDDKRLDWFIELEPYLTVSEEARQKNKIKKLEIEKKEWKEELEQKQKEFGEKLREEILKEMNDPNRKPITDLLAENEKSKKQYARIKKDVGLE